jgi:hypothetical protein
MPRNTKTSRAKKTPVRSFVYIHDGKQEGRYKGKTPVSVAKKIGNRLLKNSTKRTVVVDVKEITLNSKKKEFKYKITRVKKPKTILRNGKLITINYAIKAKAL